VSGRFCQPETLNGTWGQKEGQWAAHYFLKWGISVSSVVRSLLRGHDGAVTELAAEPCALPMCAETTCLWVQIAWAWWGPLQRSLCVVRMAADAGHGPAAGPSPVEGVHEVQMLRDGYPVQSPFRIMFVHMVCQTSYAI
jgi:hypothetical protein